MTSDQFSTVKDIGLLIIGSYAAILSTINYRQAAKKDRRSVRVQLRTSVPTYDNGLGPPFVHIEAVNDGHRQVTISLLTLRLPDKSRLFQMASSPIPGYPNTEFPARLAEGEVARVLFPYAEVGQALLARGITTKVNLVPVCEDTLGGHYVGQPWEVDPREFVSIGCG